MEKSSGKHHIDVYLLDASATPMPTLCSGEADYFRRKEAIQQALVSHLHNHLKSLEAVTLSLNTLDRQGSGMTDMYLSVLGPSAEDADSGEVGRGNQENGLIALNRLRGSEAAGGKTQSAMWGRSTMSCPISWPTGFSHTSPVCGRSLSGCAVASVCLSISLRWSRCRPIYSRPSP